MYADRPGHGHLETYLNPFPADGTGRSITTSHISYMEAVVVVVHLQKPLPKRIIAGPIVPYSNPYTFHTGASRESCCMNLLSDDRVTRRRSISHGSEAPFQEVWIKRASMA